MPSCTCRTPQSSVFRAPCAFVRAEPFRALVSLKSPVWPGQTHSHWPAQVAISKVSLWELWLAQHIAVGVWCLNALYGWHNILLWECYVQILFVNIYKTSKTHSVSKFSAVTFGNNEPCDLHVFWKDCCLVGALSCIFKSGCRKSFRGWLNQRIKNNLSSVQ